MYPKSSRRSFHLPGWAPPRLLPEIYNRRYLLLVNLLSILHLFLCSYVLSISLVLLPQHLPFQHLQSSFLLQREEGGVVHRCVGGWH